MFAFFRLKHSTPGALLVNRSYVYMLAIIVGGRQNALATLARGWHGLLLSTSQSPREHGSIPIHRHHDRERHLRHHREVGHDYDPDWINYTTVIARVPDR
jgi:hypothetical protein